MTSIDVSVVVPVHNGEDFVAQAINSALDQEGVAAEVIVLDDASTDRTRDIVAGFGDRVRLVELEKQPNHIRSTNLGVGLAHGEFISILHHDDFYLTGKLAQHVALHRANPSLGLSYSQQLYVDNRGRRLWSLRSPVSHQGYVVDGMTEFRHLMVQNYVNFANAFVPAAVYREVGAFDERLWFSAEWDMWLRIARSRRVGYLDQPLVCYRLHIDSLTHAGTRDTRGYEEQLRIVVRERLAVSALPAQVRPLRALTVANMHVSVALLKAARGQWAGALASTGRAVVRVPPWRWLQLVRSAAIVPRVGARIQLRRELRAQPGAPRR